ncbi:Phage protein Gp37/Gp68 [Aquimixticola soesokkakensis]|uniref:Phage protein Gp37/Gp68 n=1 Tax=Aquimixticola soesokkakensis TaxID=1519096 RepID=A0A1Y5SEG3_9RHOB|nr:phage Gp37/Gp68 family protein [Aquimixticola soesokkakensis]SLN36137.1 Phage protein Gp37/Gp68 [Aquimixticola soesokkakensis]
MAENSNIEWTTHTFNPWEGCQKVGPGCDNCYAEARNVRFTGGTNWGPSAPRRRTSASNWAKPIRWNKEAEKFCTRPRVFCASLADVFDNAVDPKWRADLFDLIRATPNLDWLLLTKRPGNIAKMLPADWGVGWENVWLGCTIVNQAEAERDIPKLLAVPAAVRFLSMEPLLGPVDLTSLCEDGWSAIDALRSYSANQASADWGDEDEGPFVDQPALDWIIAGGESGPNARPMNPQWARSLRDQCKAAGVAFHFKQWGEWVSVSEAEGPGDHFKFPDGRTVRRTGKKLAGRTLDGVEHDGYPHPNERRP